MISNDGGTTWSAEQQVTNADGRSEDPAVAVTGQQIHLSWNDKRTGVMEIWYRNSLDGGFSWSAETPLTNSDSYSSMVSVDGNYVDVPCGLMVIPHFHVYMAQSADTGSTFAAAHDCTPDTMGDIYPVLLRRGQNLFMTYSHFAAPPGPRYIHSADGGNTWDTAFYLGNGSTAFLALTGCALHAVYLNGGHVSYRQNPYAICTPQGISEHNLGDEILSYPNPFNNELVISAHVGASITLMDISGKILLQQKAFSAKTVVNTGDIAAGIYFLRIEEAIGNKNYKVVKQN